MTRGHLEVLWGHLHVQEAEEDQKTMGDPPRGGASHAGELVECQSRRGPELPSHTALTSLRLQRQTHLSPPPPSCYRVHRGGPDLGVFSVQDPSPRGSVFRHRGRRETAGRWGAAAPLRLPPRTGGRSPRRARHPWLKRVAQTGPGQRRRDGEASAREGA